MPASPELAAIISAVQQCDHAAALLAELDNAAQYSPLHDKLAAASALCQQAHNTLWLHQVRRVPLPETANIPQQYQQLAEQPVMSAAVRRMVDNAVRRQELRRRVDVDGEKQADIATELGVSRQAVHHAVSKARREVPADA